MIGLVNATVSYEGVKALDGLSLAVPQGRLCGIIGPGGSGKSTVCRVVAGLRRPEAGVVMVGGVDLMRAGRAELKQFQRRLGVQFQNDALFEHQTVIANIAYPLSRLFDLHAAEREGRALEWLALVGLAGFERRLPSELSGGQRRRVALARACVTGPELLLCDDPTAGLDPVTSRHILDLILGIHYQTGNTTVVVSSDVVGLLSIVEDVALVWDGRVVFQGTPLAFAASENREAARFLHDARLPFAEAG